MDVCRQVSAFITRWQCAQILEFLECPGFWIPGEGKHSGIQLTGQIGKPAVGMKNKMPGPGSGCTLISAWLTNSPESRSMR